MVAPVLKSFQAEVRPKAHGTFQTQFPLCPTRTARGGQLPLEFGRDISAPFSPDQPVL